MSRFLRSVRNDRSASLEMTPPCHSEEVADRRRNLLSIPPAVLQTNPLSPRVFGRKCGKTALEFILLADAATIPPISVALPDASAPGQPSEAHFPHLRPGGSSLAANCNKSALVFFRKYSIPPGLRPQMRKNGPGVHFARRRGNDFAHFGRFTGRVCNRTAPRGTFSAFAAGGE